MNAPKTSQPEIAFTKSLGPDELRNGIARLKKRIEDLVAFDPNKMKETHPPELAALSTSIQRTLAQIFGEGSADYNRFLPASDIQWQGPLVWFADMQDATLSEYIEHNCRNRDYALEQLRGAVRLLEEDLAEGIEIVEPSSTPEIKSCASSKVFVVHGHDNEAKNEVARFLSKIGLEEIILHERPNQGRHLLTKFREEADGASFAVVIITPDDKGGLMGESLRNRARQNVVFELGFFIGRFGADRVAALVKGDVEKPSDFDGVGYIQLDRDGAWKSLLARELRAAKVPFYAEKVFEA